MSYKDKEKEKEYHKRYEQTHREKCLEYHKKTNHKRRLETLILAGGIKCVKCGFSDWRALQVDHINGGGSKNRLDSLKLKVDIKKSPQKYQILCANCNWIKRYENKEAIGKPSIIKAKILKI